MLQRIARYILRKIGIDYDKLRKFLDNVDVYKDHEEKDHIHFNADTSFKVKIKAPDFQWTSKNKNE